MRYSRDAESFRGEGRDVFRIYSSSGESPDTSESSEVKKKSMFEFICMQTDSFRFIYIGMDFLLFV